MFSYVNSLNHLSTIGIGTIIILQIGTLKHKDNLLIVSQQMKLSETVKDYSQVVNNKYKTVV